MIHASPRRRRRTVLLALLLTLAATGSLAGAFLLLPGGALATPPVPSPPLTADPFDDGGITVPAGLPGDGPGSATGEAAEGVIPAGAAVSIHDGDLPAIALLDPELRAAVAAATAAAAAEGIEVRVSSGWRSAAYQARLFDEAVRTYGSAEAAAAYVAPPDASTHVTGDAVDVVPVDAQYWLIEHGATWGLCQTYANEVWHFERATTPGGDCPTMWADASLRP